MLNQQTEERICKLIEEVTGLMGLKLKASVYPTEGQIEVNLAGSDRAYLITDNGETILSLQYIFARMIHLQFPETEDLHILLDSDGYMYRHEEELRRMAHSAIQKVRRERRRVKLPPMNPYDRRIIHMEISNTRDFDSISEGEGFFKKIVVQRKQSDAW